MSRTCSAFALSIISLLAAIPVITLASAETPDLDRPWEVLDSYTSTIFMDPGEVRSFRFDPDLGKMVPDQTEDQLPPAAVQALDEVPEWTRTDLERAFFSIGRSRAATYAQLILNCPDDRYLDELAFSISHTPPEVLERSSVYPDVFMENVEALYLSDQHIDYADIVDLSGSSTLRYWVNESDTRNPYHLPPDIYYWYVVHPKITDEDPTYISPGTGQPSSGGEFWRDHLFNHADSSYPPDTATSTVLYPKNATPPLLREVLSGVDTVWNGESYHSPAGYLNNGTGNRRPFDYRDHAIEKISNWVGKTLPLNVREEGERIGRNPERSVQPVRISRNHYGNCGELQDLTIAAARACLIPARGVLNTGEDHVWIEFWERGWHQWDNYWSDGGSVIDDFGNYDADFPGSWGKELSTVFSWRGDDHVQMVTGNYSDTATFRARVLDPSGRPVDGATVMLATESYYDPDYLTISTWGHTDTNGEMVFDIGDSRNFWGHSSSSLGNDPPDSGGNIQVTQVVSGSQIGASYAHNFRMPDNIGRPAASRITGGLDDGEYLIRIDFEVDRAYLHGKNLITENTFTMGSDTGGVLDLYLTDGENHMKCMSGSDFSAYEINESVSSGTLISYLTGEEHFILSNMGCLNTEKLVNFNVTIYSLPVVLLSSPDDGARITHTDEVEFTGGAHSNIGLEKVEWRIDGGKWLKATDVSGDWTRFSFTLNTTPLSEGEHNIEVRAVTDEGKSVRNGISILVEDHIPPEVAITAPRDDEVLVQGEPMAVWGPCSDDYTIEELTISLDGGTPEDITSSIVDGNWSWSLDTLDLVIGDHDILVTAWDPSGHSDDFSVSFYLTEIVPPVVTIMSPENNTLFRSGDPLEFEGEASDNVELISLDMYMDGERAARISVPDRGRRWSLELNSATMPEGEHEVEVRAEDSEGNRNSSHLGIIIDGTPPGVEITSPASDLLLAPRGTFIVTASVQDRYGLNDVRLVLDGKRTVVGQLNDGRWEMGVDLSTLSPGKHEYHVEAEDSVGLSTKAFGSFTIDDEAPTIYSYVTDGEEFTAGDTVYINGSVSERYGVSSLIISAGAESWNLTEALNGGFFSLEWDTTGILAGNYTFEIRAVDLVGNEGAILFTVSFTEKVPNGGGTGDGNVTPAEKEEGGIDPILLVLLIGLVLLLLVVVAIMLILVRRRNQTQAVLPPQGFRGFQGPYPAMQGAPPGQVHPGLPDAPAGTQAVTPAVERSAPPGTGPGMKTATADGENPALPAASVGMQGLSQAQVPRTGERFG